MQAAASGSPRHLLAQVEQRQKDVEAYVATKLTELKRREEDIARRERALEVRDQDVRFREKLVAKWERDLEGRGVAQAQTQANAQVPTQTHVQTQAQMQLPPRSVSTTAAPAQSQSADRRASLGAPPPQALERQPLRQPLRQPQQPSHELGLGQAAVEASSPTLPPAVRLNAAPEMAPPAGERRRSSERFDLAPSVHLDYAGLRRESSGAASSEQRYGEERRAFSRAQSVDELLEAARRVHLKQEPEAARQVLGKAGSTSGSGSDAENISPNGSNRNGGSNGAVSRGSSGSSSQGSGVAAPPARRASLGGKADAEVSSWLRRNVAGAKEYAALAPRLPRTTSVSRLYR